MVTRSSLIVGKADMDRAGNGSTGITKRFTAVLEPSDQLSEDLFNKFTGYVYSKTGIYLKPEKYELLCSRLGKRLRATGINSYREYYEYLVSDPKGTECIEFINSVSTNFTSFFRENSHFEFLISTVLPDFVKQGLTRKRDIVFWSSACSSGQEPYTLAMVLEEFSLQQAVIRYRIFATDISTKVLAIGIRGVYSDDQLDKVPPQYLKKYFQKGVGQSAGLVKVKDPLRGKVMFERFNLMDNFPWNEAFDIIFCRNVMIYFDRKTQQKLVGKFHRSLRPGGYLFIGHSESLSGLEHEFVQVAATAYRK